MDRYSDFGGGGGGGGSGGGGSSSWGTRHDGTENIGVECSRLPPSLTCSVAGPSYSLSKEQIQKDLMEERPPWILSSFGPGKDAPAQLFGGYPMEQTFEVLRLHYLKGTLSGNQQAAVGRMTILVTYSLVHHS